MIVVLHIVVSSDFVYMPIFVVLVVDRGGIYQSDVSPFAIWFHPVVAPLGTSWFGHILKRQVVLQCYLLVTIGKQIRLGKLDHPIGPILPQVSPRSFLEFH